LLSSTCCSGCWGQAPFFFTTHHDTSLCSNIKILIDISNKQNNQNKTNKTNKTTKTNKTNSTAICLLCTFGGQLGGTQECKSIEWFVPDSVEAVRGRIGHTVTDYCSWHTKDLRGHTRAKLGSTKKIVKRDWFEQFPSVGNLALRKLMKIKYLEREINKEDV